MSSDRYRCLNNGCDLNDITLISRCAKWEFPSRDTCSKSILSPVNFCFECPANGNICEYGMAYTCGEFLDKLQEYNANK